MSRLLNGFNYFWDKTPKTWKPADVIYLHQWQKLLKESINVTEPKEEDIYEMAKKIFAT